MYEAERLAAENLIKPIPVWCNLHGQLPNYAAMVLVHRDGKITAPEVPESRVVIPVEKMPGKDVGVLGAPRWTPLTAPAECKINDSKAVICLLQEMYYMSDEELARLEAIRRRAA